MKMLLWLGLWFPENWTMICIGRAHTHWLISPWTMIWGIFLLMDLSLLNLLWSGRLGGVRIQEDKLILDVSKEVQGVVRTSTNDSQWGWQCEAGLQPRYVDRVDIAEPEPQRDEKEQWFPWALLSFILGWLQTTFPHLKNAKYLNCYRFVMLTKKFFLSDGVFCVFTSFMTSVLSIATCTAMSSLCTKGYVFSK